MRIKGFIVLAILLAVSVCGQQQTWRLKAGKEWQKIDKKADSEPIIAIAEAKQLVSTGQTAKAKKAFAKLKKNYPQFAGEDFDAYVKAELLYSQRKFVEASDAYDKFIEQYPDSPLYQSALERQYQIATAFLGGHKRTALKIFKLSAYEEGTEIMTKIADRAGDAPIAKDALTTLARSNEKRGAWHEAYLAWAAAADRWPTGSIGQEALLGMARSLKNDYRGPKFDAKVLESSKSYYRQFQERYPLEAKKLDISKILTDIEVQLAEKDLEIADYYARTGSFTSANLYYQKIIDTWPNTAAAKIAEQKMQNISKQQQMQQASNKKKKLDLKGLLL